MLRRQWKYGCFCGPIGVRIDSQFTGVRRATHAAFVGDLGEDGGRFASWRAQHTRTTAGLCPPNKVTWGGLGQMVSWVGSFVGGEFAVGVKGSKRIQKEHRIHVDGPTLKKDMEASLGCKLILDKEKNPRFWGVMNCYPS